MSTSTSDSPPTRSNSRSCSTRSSLTCTDIGMSSMSSRKIVPPSANSKRPRRSRCASVNAPFSWPNSSVSSSVSGKAPHDSATNGLSRAVAELVDRARDALLARAALPLDQHRRVGRRDRAHGLDHGLHRRALTDHAGQPLTVLAVELLAQLLVLAEQRTHALDALQSLDDLVVEERLLDVVVRAVLHRLDRVIDRRVGRHHEHLGVRPRALRREQHVHAARAGQPHVGDHHVEALLAEQVDRRLPVPDELDVIAFALQVVTQRDGDRLLVLDEQHAHRARGLGFGHALPSPPPSRPCSWVSPNDTIVLPPRSVA